MAGLPRPGPPGVATSKRTTSSMRPPARPTNQRAQTATPNLMSGRFSPAESVSSRAGTPAAGTKRKERDFDAGTASTSGHGAGDSETNINVVVRCRGRNDREVRENSGVVVSTDGVKGRTVELSMGPSALSNKAYSFDRVFSPAADQGMVFEEVVAPIIDEVMGGFNCTIFAYGQTGTGKTYTMSGDITDTLPLPDDAGIIPRVLHALFNKLEGDESENSVKCSFIELYNEELRDLLSADDNVKLKLFEDGSKKGHTSTIVQGMEESHIKSASKGIKLLREGSHKRQVAATKCNDLSSRSHTVFTVTVYLKRTSETGEDFVSAGKLNLVDLAGSENIQRSGAENKRAAEAGLINKSLLTLGRVINALVDKSSHIPYRESKLTRLLQDSLGGRTKTCIIATLSPAKSNLEETISTLDYAFRAKNIRNKPQINQMVSKKTLFKEFTSEIEKLKSELIATRQRNGVYLTQENYEEITTESESRRILSEEQKDKIDTMEANLRNKVQELFSITTNFTNLKKDNEATRVVLEGTKSLLEKTEVVLDHTRRSLEEEAVLRKAHAKTEEDLASIGQDLISTLGKTTSDIGGLHSKLRRRSNLQSVNRQNWNSSQQQVSGTTQSVDERIAIFQSQQQNLMVQLSERMQGFVQDELQKLGASQAFLQENMESFGRSEKEVNEQTAKSRDDMNEVLEEIKTLREDVKQKVGAGLSNMSAAAERISAGIVTELEAFHTQLHLSYASLGKDFKTTFDDVVKQLEEQQIEVEGLRQQISQANTQAIGANKNTQARLNSVIETEKEKAAAERQQLLTQITALLDSNAAAQEKRLTEAVVGVNEEIDSANTNFESANQAYNQGMDGWVTNNADFLNNVVKSRENVKTKIKGDFAAANAHTTSLRETTSAVHGQTVEIVNSQMAHMDEQLHSLDDIVARIRAQNDMHHASHTSSLSALASTVQTSYENIGNHFTTSFSRVQDLGADMESKTASLQATLPTLASDAEIRTTLRNLREEISRTQLQEYAPTGETPARVSYTYPTVLPRTESRDHLLAKLRGESTSPDVFSAPPALFSTTTEAETPTASPQRTTSKGMIFTDAEPTTEQDTKPSRPTSQTGLRELDPNTLPAPQTSISAPPTTILNLNDSVIAVPGSTQQPPLKRQNTTGNANGSKLPQKKKTRMTVAGAGGPLDRENFPVSTVGGKEDFSRSVGGRRLRSHGST
ncbi:kinesin-domain-containing protein [Saccharata proteae CBS 121410]|uniref:Kinesin-domain-containing protein n=1 Tax=Saccharata proteae CBS 121410 TaxID=1314787 RepID=A0A6A5YAC9_9PEZI|nr:kinesin-domain-containing protein [Saccharata proteae CBS 121410]